jgi:hypothetical protein
MLNSTRAFFAVQVLLFSTAALAQSDVCVAFQDAKIVTEDGKFLGTLENQYSSNSIFNKYGVYGNKYNSNSIWNKYGSFGSQYANNSPFNKYAANPPLIVKNSTIVARLSVNKSVKGAVNPIVLAVTCFDYEPEN